ncbi:MAG: YidC/Oxa1 family membrane protein insertase [Anaerococcus sp.]
MNFFAGVLGSLMRWIYDTLANNFTESADISFYAISIIIMTLIVNIITIPMMKNQKKTAEKSSELKPKMDAIKKKYSYDPQIMQQKMQELYKEEGVNPGISSCFVMIFQFLILIALYRVIREPEVYVFKDGFQNIQDNFLWVPSLQDKDPLFYGLPLLTSISQFANSLFSMKTNPQMSGENNPMSSMNNMLLIMPLLYFFMFRNLPAGLPLYWTTSSIVRLILLAITYLIGKKEGEKEVEDEKNNN